MEASTDVLNRLWAVWLEKYNSREPNLMFWLRHYSNVQRNSDRAIRFEIWIESNGGRVVQKNKSLYIQVWDENLFMMLVLAHV